MGWREFLAWVGAMNKQRAGAQVTAESWKNADSDGWWVQQRRERAELQRQ